MGKVIKYLLVSSVYAADIERYCITKALDYSVFAQRIAWLKEGNIIQALNGKATFRTKHLTNGWVSITVNRVIQYVQDLRDQDSVLGVDDIEDSLSMDNRILVAILREMEGTDLWLILSKVQREVLQKLSTDEKNSNLDLLDAIINVGDNN